MSAIHGGTKSKVTRFGWYHASFAAAVPLVCIAWPAVAFEPVGKW